MADPPDAPTVLAPAGMVATTDSLASASAVSILRAGGTAGDAAVAASAVLAVTSQHLCGMGGDLFVLVHQPGEQPLALCAAGRAGSGADALQMRCEGLERMPTHGDIRSVTIPGCVDGWLQLHRQYGRLPLAQVLEPAITYAAAGFPASPLLAASAADVLHLPGAHDYYEPAMVTGGKLEAGKLIRRPGVAATLGAIVASGRSGFYLGAFGDGLVTLGAGLFKRSDLSRSQAEWIAPLKISAWGYDLWAPPPPSQAYLTLSGAAVAADLPLPTDPDDPAWPHLLAEAARQVGRDRSDVLCDQSDGSALLGNDRLAERRAGIDPDHRGADPVAAAAGDTTALCAVDRDRMAVSLVMSNASGWGAHIVEESTGIFLHNRGQGFSLEAGHPNEFQPGRRPAHTLSPLLVSEPDGELKAVLGTMGGDSQPQVLLQLAARLLHSRISPGDAIDAARWILGEGGFGTWDNGGPDMMMIEQHASEQWEEGLAQRDHHVERSHFTPDHRFGHAQLIEVDDGVLRGAADPRALVGAAIGY